MNTTSVRWKRKPNQQKTTHRAEPWLVDHLITASSQRPEFVRVIPTRIGHKATFSGVTQLHKRASTHVYNNPFTAKWCLMLQLKKLWPWDEQEHGDCTNAVVDIEKEEGVLALSKARRFVTYSPSENFLSLFNSPRIRPHPEAFHTFLSICKGYQVWATSTQWLHGSHDLACWWQDWSYHPSSFFARVNYVPVIQQSLQNIFLSINTAHDPHFYVAVTLLKGARRVILFCVCCVSRIFLF